MYEINVHFVGLKMYEINVHFVDLKMYKKCMLCRSNNVQN